MYEYIDIYVLYIRYVAHICSVYVYISMVYLVYMFWSVHLYNCLVVNVEYKLYEAVIRGRAIKSLLLYIYVINFEHIFILYIHIIFLNMYK